MRTTFYQSLVGAAFLLCLSGSLAFSATDEAISEKSIGSCAAAVDMPAVLARNPEKIVEAYEMLKAGVVATEGDELAHLAEGAHTSSASIQRED